MNRQAGPGLKAARRQPQQGRRVKISTPSWSDQFLYYFFPDRCLICKAVLSSPGDIPLCPFCRRLYLPAGRICPRCEQVVLPGESCPCGPERGPLQVLFALTWYERQWRLLIHDLKYRKRRCLARPLGLWLGREFTDRAAFDPDLIAPIPLHRRRLGERGFNQGELIARHVARVMALPCRNLLNKHLDTPSQAILSRRDRLVNVRGAFSLRTELRPGCRVLLIDDIYSTGATMREAAAVLQRGGAVVGGAVVAYNPARPSPEAADK